jgi:branched-chain amino acid transport system substrate-binding protein
MYMLNTQKKVAFILILNLTLATVGLFIISQDESTEKTTILRYQQLGDSLKIDVEHRHYQTLSIKKNGETYLRLLINIDTDNTGGGDFTVSKDENTVIEVELDKLPSGASLASRLIVVDDSGSDGGEGAQLAVIVKLGNSAKSTWSVKDPKLLLTGLNLGFDADIEEYLPTVQISVDPTVLTRAQYYEWLNTILLENTITIGYIAPDTTSLEVNELYLEQIIAPDLTDYVRDLGYDLDVQFIIEDAQGQTSKHLEKIQGFHSMGVNLVIGGGWSSQAQASLSYVNANNMLLVSASSTSPTLAIANDRLFRMCPNDGETAPALVDMMWSYGIKSVIIIQRGDSWGDGIVNLFTPAWEAKGGEIAGEVVRYATDTTNFSSYLTVANDMAETAVANNYGDTERVGVLLLCFNELSLIATQCEEYTPLYDCPFFGSDGTARSQGGMDDAPEQVNHMRVFSLLTQSPDSAEYNAMEARYEELTHQQFGTYSAYLYDAAWAIVKSVIETGSTDASVVAAAFPGVCENLVGISGPCKLSEFGDRCPSPYDIWFFAPDEGMASSSYIGGVYNPDDEVTTWDEDLLMDKLGYVPAGP